MSNTSLPTPAEQLDFKIILRNLRSHVRDAMVSLHASQTASLNAGHRTSFTTLRTSLKAEWDTVIAYLQKCYDFCEDAALLIRLEQEPEETYLSLLEELARASEQLSREGEDLVQTSLTGLGQLSSLTAALSHSLRRPMGVPDVGPDEAYKTQSPHSNVFLGVNLSPDGLTAIAASTTSLTEIRNNLQSLCLFWSSVSDACRSFAKSNARITQDNAQRFGETWKGYQQEIMSAKVSIAASCDAVVVEAIATPTTSIFRRQPRRRGSSKSEKSLPVLPPTLPRRMSSVDDDTVPSACWGFGVFSSGERRSRRK
ncbi:hypothetical protein C8J57DRAFT_1217060 [Mycena rebaudengoi]|nr:hypothetical protein C8J57DRAFT_1217060 [Mycena rebaudengoi]